MGSLFPCRASKKLQAIVAPVFYPHLFQYVDIHVCRMQVRPVKPRIPVHERAEQEMTHTIKFPGMYGKRQKAGPFVRMKINEDIIGWVYFTGLPQISYPVLQADDNEYYVHRTYDLSSDTSKAGCIFMDYRMADDFSSPYSIIYGHNVRDGSMLSDLARLKDQTLYDEEPYFWILTPEGNYRYQIFSIFQCHRAADVFQRSFDGWGEDFSKWQSELKLRNSMQGDVKLREDGHVIAFSTCVPNSFDRTIVCGTYIDGDLITDLHEENEIEKKQLK